MPQLVRVEVTDEEVVVQGGTSRVVWFVLQDEKFVRLASVAGVELSEPRSAAGVIWRSRLSIAVPPNTVFMRRESRPRSDRRRDPLDYLTLSSPSSLSSIRETRFRAAPDGRLAPVAAPGGRRG
jgi:hypothetical protein